MQKDEEGVLGGRNSDDCFTIILLIEFLELLPQFSNNPKKKSGLRMHVCAWNCSNEKG